MTRAIIHGQFIWESLVKLEIMLPLYFAFSSFRIAFIYTIASHSWSDASAYLHREFVFNQWQWWWLRFLFRTTNRQPTVVAWNFNLCVTFCIESIFDLNRSTAPYSHQIHYDDGYILSNWKHTHTQLNPIFIIIQQWMILWKQFKIALHG